jgi:hypothetical protein
MNSPTDQHLTTIEQVRAIIGEEVPVVRTKLFRGLDELIFGLQNIVANPRVALIFLVPGTEETLRIHGSAELTAAPEIVERLSARGQPALLAIRVRVEQCFFHCAKAFKRSRLWQPEWWPERLRISFGKLLAPRLGGSEQLERSIDRMVEEDYETNL